MGSTSSRLSCIVLWSTLKNDLVFCGIKDSSNQWHCTIALEATHTLCSIYSRLWHIPIKCHQHYTWANQSHNYCKDITELPQYCLNVIHIAASTKHFPLQHTQSYYMCCHIQPYEVINNKHPVNCNCKDLETAALKTSMNLVISC